MLDRISREDLRIAFVYPAFESIAVELLFAILKEKNFKPAFFFDPSLFNDSYISSKLLAKVFSYRRKIFSLLKDYSPHIVLFSVLTDIVDWVIEYAKFVKDNIGSIVIVGGHHITSSPRSMLEYEFIDFGIMGEGEEALLELLDAIIEDKDFSGIRNLVYKDPSGNIVQNPLRPLLKDLDRLPFPYKDIYLNTPLSPTLQYTIMASRGCPYRCSYCYNSMMWKRYENYRYRVRSVENVIKELKIAKEKYNPWVVEFYDDQFPFFMDYVKDFSKEYKKNINIPFRCFINPLLVNEERILLLKEAGCMGFTLGVQTINDYLRRDILNRRETTEQVREAINIIHRNGLELHIDNIIDLPNEKEEHVVELVRFYNEIRKGLPRIFWLRYYPATDILDIAYKEGILSSEDVRAIHKGEFQKSLVERKNIRGNYKNKVRLYILFTAMFFLPKKFVSFLLDKGLYRYIPVLPGLQRFLYHINRIVKREKNKRFRVFIIKLIKRYRYYIFKKLRFNRDTKDFVFFSKD